MKKTLSLILALLMSVSTAATIFADEATPVAVSEDAAIVEDADVDVESDEIRFLKTYEIMKGKEDGLVHAADDVKRYEMAYLMGRVATGWVENDKWEDGTANDSIFTDLDNTKAADYFGVISYVNQKGIVVGYGDGTFKPENTVTYREALTMAVRTLGYGAGLEYPWGFIEKAISLGLTEGIEEVAYTDTLNRGVVAKIVYNMMFAETAKGGTLAMKSFGIEFGWENIVVTADDKATYVAGGKNVAEGYVAFQILNDDGSIADDVFYTNEALAFGGIYKALFEIDEDEDLVKLVDAYPYIGTEVENVGITDDNGDKYETADVIGAYLKNYTIVDKYSDKILANAGKLNNELIVKTSATLTYVKNIKALKDIQVPYVLDWATGDILGLVTKDGVSHYEVEWSYNATLNVYFRVKTVGDIEWDVVKEVIDNNDAFDKESIALELKKLYAGIELMDAEDVEAMNAAIAKAREEEGKNGGYKTLKADEIAYNAYSLLTVYNLDKDDEADFGIYEAYRLAKYNGISDNKYKFSDKEFLVEGVNADTKFGGKEWLNTYTIEGLSKDYKGWVIYGVDEATNTIKIVKEIPEFGKNTDKDSYVTTGIVRGYSMSAKKVTIDDTIWDLGYEGLVGAQFTAINKDETYQKTWSDEFDKWFNQYVEFVVVDNKIVKIDCKNPGLGGYIVVEKYLGIDSENYIVVEGYNTNDLKYDTFRIGSYNKWAEGDYFFYSEALKEEIAESFAKGTVYEVLSADKTAENGTIYYVETIGNNGMNPDFEDIDSKGTIEITFADGYRHVKYTATGADAKEKAVKVADGDKYVVIGYDQYNAFVDRVVDRWMPITVFSGKVVDETWTIKGEVLVGNEGASTFIIVNPTVVSGFDYDTFGTTFVVPLEKGIISERNYNGYGKDYYIYGATTYTYTAFDLLKGADTTVETTNGKLALGNVYIALDGEVVDNEKLTWNDFVQYAPAVYCDDDNKTADYKFYNDWDNQYNVVLKTATLAEVDGWVKDADDSDKEAFSKEVISRILFPTSTKQYKDLVGSYTTKLVELNTNGSIAKISALNDAAVTKLTDDKYTSFDVFAVYKMDGSTVLYVIKTGADKETPKADQKIESTNAVIKNTTGAETANIVADAVIDYVLDEDNKIVSAKIDSIEIYYDLADNTIHNYINDNGFYMGYKGTCDVQTKTVASVDGAEIEYLTDVVSKIYDCEDEDVVHDCYNENHTNCKMVKGIKLDLGGKTLDLDGSVIKVTYVASEDYTFDFALELVVGDDVAEIELAFIEGQNRGTSNVFAIDATR